MSLDTGFMLLLIVGSLLLLIAWGMPLAFVMGSLAIVFSLFTFGLPGLAIIIGKMWDTMTTYMILSLPLFIMMGVILERSGVAGALFDSINKWSGGLRGGIAASGVVMCMIFSAMTGLSAAATVTLGLTALPEMLKRGYNKDMAIGPILAGGALGILIPPSATMIVFALVSGASVGKLFIAGIIPGVMLGFMFIAYILIRCYVQPRLAPALPVEERAGWREKFTSLRALILPIIVIVAVMGSIFLGIATPTEAAAVGVFGAMICAMINRKFGWWMINDSLRATVITCGMGGWILMSAKAYSALYFTIGAPDFLQAVLTGMPGGRWGIMAMIQLIWFLFGFVIGPWEYIMITAPLFVPLATSLGFDITWLGITFIMNVETAYLTPPVGANLFYMKAVAPRQISMSDIIHSVWWFVPIQLVALAIVIAVPQIALWLPSLMWGK